MKEAVTSLIATIIFKSVGFVESKCSNVRIYQYSWGHTLHLTLCKLCLKRLFRITTVRTSVMSPLASSCYCHMNYKDQYDPLRAQGQPGRARLDIEQASTGGTITHFISFCFVAESLKLLNSSPALIS